MPRRRVRRASRRQRRSMASTGLRAALLRPPGVVRRTTLTEKLLTYALGRGLEPADAPAVRAIDARTPRYRLSVLIAGSRRGQERAISDEEIPMIVTKDGAAAADLSARHGRHAGAAPAGRDGAGVVGHGAAPRRTRCAVWDSSTFRWARTSRNGPPTATAASPSCRRS